MGLDGSTYYESCKHLNAKVIKPAVTEVNKTSNILITPEFQKMGRQISEIRFLIKENPQLAMLNIDDSEALRQGAVYASLIALGVSDRLARQWISEHGEDYVLEKIAYLKGRGEVESPVRYLRAALRDDYKADAPKPRRAKAITADKARRERESHVKTSEVARENSIRAERRWRNSTMAHIQRLVESRTPTQRDADKKLFLKYLNGDILRSEIARLGWNSALCDSQMFDFWEGFIPNAFHGISKQND